MFVYVTNIYGNFKYVYVQHLKPCTLKKSFKTNCICNHLYQVNAYHVVCLSLYPVCLPRQPGWQWPGAPQRVGAHGGGIWVEDAGSAASTRSPPPSISLSVSPAEGDGEEPQAGGTIPLHTSRQTLHRVAQLYAAALQGGWMPATKRRLPLHIRAAAGRLKLLNQVKAGNKERVQHRPSFLPCYYYWSSAGSSRTSRGPCTKTATPTPATCSTLAASRQLNKHQAHNLPGFNQSINKLYKFCMFSNM